MEILFAIAVVSLAAAGIGTGVVLGRGPAKTSCGAADKIESARCEDCPLRRRVVEEEAR